MNIAYFPFTGIPEKTASAIYGRFGRFIVYSPVSGHEPHALRVLADQNRIDLRCPILGEESLVMCLCRSFRSWGAVHQGRTGGLKQFAESGFYNDQFAAEIRSEILKDGGTLSRQEHDPIRNARVFLQLAQEFDLEQADIESRLTAAENATRQLFDELRGELGGSGVSGISHGAPEDAGAFMTVPRMAAWSLLAGNDERLPQAFVTHSRAVLEKLSDRFPSLVHAGSLSGIGMDAGGVLERMHQISRSPWEGPDTVQLVPHLSEAGTDSDFRVDVYVVPDCSPGALMQSFADPVPESGGVAADIRHSFICLVTGLK